MDLYSIALFVHIVGALLLFVLLTVEGVALRAGFSAAPMNRTLGPISAAAILVPGAYMMWAQAGWSGWVAVGIVTYVLIALAGAFTGINVMRGRMATSTAALSWSVRVGLALGVVFDMTVKPNVLVAVLAVIVGGVLGAAASLLRRRQAAAT